MTNLMEEAIRRVAELSDGRQNLVASLVLAEIDAGDVWEHEFAGDRDLLDAWVSPPSVLDEAEHPSELDFYHLDFYRNGEEVSAFPHP